MRHPLCFLKMLWRSLTIGELVSGCDFVPSCDETPINVAVFHCKRCGEVSVRWAFGPMDKDTGELL
jgi:hypothetical protein